MVKWTYNLCLSYSKCKFEYKKGDETVSVFSPETKLYQERNATEVWKGNT